MVDFELDSENKKYTTVHSRYHVSDEFGFIEGVQFLAEAQRIGKNYIESNVSIFDSMAHKGNPQTWEYYNGQWIIVDVRN